MTALSCAQSRSAYVSAKLRGRYSALAVPQFAMAVLMVGLSALIVATYNRYGFNFDDQMGVSRAQRLLDFFASVSTSKTTSSSDIFHGSAPDVIALVLQKLIPSLSYDSRHLVDALFGLAGIFYTYKFGSKLAGNWIGFFAALFLAVTPMWFGYMFVNHKDIPFATVLLASSYYSLLALTEPRVSPLLWLKTGVAIGLLVATKAGGLPALPFIVAIFIACLRYVPKEPELDLPEDFFRRLLTTIMVGFLGIVASSLLFLPQLYYSGLSELRSFLVLEKHGGKTGWYAFRYFTITTPVFLLYLGVTGFFMAIYYRNAPILASALVFALAFLGSALAGARVYNGCRHFLCVYPFFMLAAGYPVSLMLELLKGNLAARCALVAAIGLCGIATVHQMYSLFPYQYSYYNFLVGGFRGADGVYDIDIWRTANREALNRIGRKIQPGTDVRVYSCGSQIDFLMHPEFQRVKMQEQPDYIVSLRRGCPPEKFEGLPVVAEIRREGVSVARVYTPVH